MLQELKFAQRANALRPSVAMKKAAVRLSAAPGFRRSRTQIRAVASPTYPSQTVQPQLDGSSATERAATLATVSGKSPFLTLGVDPMLVDALPAMTVSRPSPIQAAALPAVLSGANCAVQSYTGSGKTLSYLLPTMTLALRRAEAMAADRSFPRRMGLPEVPIQVLVIAPSQELAMQIMRVAKSLLPHEVARYAVQQVIGGANPKRQVEALAAVPGPLVVVGTPGRLAEMVRTGALRLHRCPIMVLDEADQLLAPAFAEDINHINEHCGKRLQQLSTAKSAAALDQPGSSASFEVVPSSRQTVLVSATLTPSVLGRAAAWCPDPRFVSAGAVPSHMEPEEPGQGEGGDKTKPAWGWGARGWDGPASPLGPKTRGSVGGVESNELIPTMPPQLSHYFLVTEPRHKVDVLRRTIHALDAQRALVFMNFQQRLQDTQYKLQARGMKAAALHGELPRLVRSNILNDFRRGRMRALVVSDVAARGLDVPQCDAVFHLELPSSAAHYAHRAGRTGRLSAALAAAAAAEAATAAAVDAAADAAGAAPAAPPAAAAAATAAQEEDSAWLLEQSAGSVVTVIAPHERFVVEKLAQQLNVPLLEAHLSHGQLRLGPPPGGYSFDKEDKVEQKGGAGAGAGAAAQTSESGKGKKAGRKAEAEAEGGDDVAARRDRGAQASTSGRSGKDVVAATTPSADAGGKAGAKKATAAAATAGAVTAAKGKKGRETATKVGPTEDEETEGGKYEVVLDDDDDIVLDDEEFDEDDEYDYEVLDEDLAALKALRPWQVRQLAGTRAGATAPTAAGAGAGKVAADAGQDEPPLQLKAQRKKRTVLPGVEPGSSAAAAEGKAGKGAAGLGRHEARRGHRKGAKRPAAGDEDDNDVEENAEVEEGRQGAKARAVSRKALMSQVQLELEELRLEKELARQRGAPRGGRGNRR